MFSELLLKPCAIITWFLPSNIKLLFTGNATAEFINSVIFVTSNKPRLILSCFHL